MVESSLMGNSCGTVMLSDGTRNATGSQIGESLVAMALTEHAVSCIVKCVVYRPTFLPTAMVAKIVTWRYLTVLTALVFR